MGKLLQLKGKTSVHWKRVMVGKAEKKIFVYISWKTFADSEKNNKNVEAFLQIFCHVQLL